jgi:hypothetical protein
MQEVDFFKESKPVQVTWQLLVWNLRIAPVLGTKEKAEKQCYLQGCAI